MDATYPVVMGDRGRVVVPAQLRERRHLTAGVPLVLLDTPHGIVLATREQAKALVRARLAGDNLVEELLAERRALSVAEDRE